MRRRRLKGLWKRLQQLPQQTLTRDQLLLKLGAAKKESGHAMNYPAASGRGINKENIFNIAASGGE